MELYTDSARRRVRSSSVAFVVAALAVGLQIASAEDAPVKTICVLGASGNVGNGIVRELLEAGHRVVAVSRSASNLEAIRERFADAERLETLQGGVGTDEQGMTLREALLNRYGMPDAVVASLGSSEWNAPMQVVEASSETLRRAFDDNFMTHFIAARSLLPALAPGGVYVSISGGLADFVLPGNGHLSMTQSAQRTLFEVLAQETQDWGVHVRMLGLYSIIATDRNRDVAEPDWITDRQVGQRVLEIIDRPDAFPGPILSLRSERYR